MQRETAYKSGIVVIILATLLSPLSHLILGKIEKGKVINISFEYYDLPILPSTSHPIIEFEYKGKTYDINGEEDQKYLVGDEVKVIFYPWNPGKAKVLTFSGLFIETIIQLPIGLLIWWAFFKSFPNLFVVSEEPLSLYNLLYKRVKKRERSISDAHILIRIFIYLLIVLIAVVLLNALWSIYNEMMSDKISYQVGFGIMIVIVVLLVTIIQKIRKG